MNLTSEHIILGIDPGTRITGFGVLGCANKKTHYIASGCIKAKGETLGSRLQQIGGDLKELIEVYRPTIAAIESVFVSKNVKSALRLGEARGCAMGILGQYDIPIEEYATRRVKQAVVGYGGASKEQVHEMVTRLLSIQGNLQIDASDALAVALCHAQCFDFLEAIS